MSDNDKAGVNKSDVARLALKKAAQQPFVPMVSSLEGEATRGAMNYGLSNEGGYGNGKDNSGSAPIHLLRTPACKLD